MLFRDKRKELNKNIKKTVEDTSVRIDLEPKRTDSLEIIKEVYSKDVRKISRNKLIKLAIDLLVKEINERPEEEAIEFITELYKEALF